MILFKVNFTDNIANTASSALPKKRIEWKEHPYRIVSIEVYANNNDHAMKIAQEKANTLLKNNK